MYKSGDYKCLTYERHPKYFKKCKKKAAGQKDCNVFLGMFYYMMLICTDKIILIKSILMLMR